MAAALLAKMRYNENEIRELRFAYLRMLLRLRKKLDDAKLALINGWPEEKIAELRKRVL